MISSLSKISRRRVPIILSQIAFALVDDRNDHSAMIPARQAAQTGSSNRALQSNGS